MQIQSGKLYENKTFKYLYPCLNYYGEDLMAQLSKFYKVAIGVNDFNTEKKGNCIYILIDTNIKFNTSYETGEYRKSFAKFLNWIVDKEYYVTDYIYEKDLHMVVLKIPKKFNNTYLNFVKGKYSEMYEEVLVPVYFKYITSASRSIQDSRNQKLKEIRDVLLRDSRYLPIFVAKVNNLYKTEATVEDFREAELDFPPKLEEETFNYKGT